MINLNDNEKKWILKRLKEVSKRQPSNYVSGFYIKSVETLKNQFEQWLEGKLVLDAEQNIEFEEQVKSFIELEIKDIALNRV